MRHASFVRHTRLAVCGLVPLLAACGSDKPAKPAAAATVQNPVTEGQLTTLKLTADAVRHLAIETVAVDSATISPSRIVGGEIVVPPGQTLMVSAPVAGTVMAPENGAVLLPGARVAPRAVLMRLVALPPDRDLLRTQQDLVVAEARLKQAEAEADRVAKLFAERLVAARDNERAQADLAAARAMHEAASGQRRLVRGEAPGDARGLTPLVITAPDGGVVRTISASPGQAVAAGAPLVEIVRLDRLWVRVPVYAGDASRIARGAVTVQALSGSSAGPVLSATPIAAPPSADATAASVDLFYELRGANVLRPGERVSVTLPVAGQPARSLVVPLTAILRDMHGGSWVYERMDSVTFMRRRVEVSRVVGGKAVLALGPKLGTPVVTAGSVELFGTEFGAGK